MNSSNMAGKAVAIVIGSSTAISAGLDPDDALLVQALQELGTAVDAVPWDDLLAEWEMYDLVIVRSPWDYPPRLREFIEWANKVPRLANPASVIRWNSNKLYLRRLEEGGIRTVPTTFVEVGENWTPPEQGEWVVKPAVGAASDGTGRYSLPADHEKAALHVADLQSRGRSVMIQPYVSAIDTAGETALVFLANASEGQLEFSHAVGRAAHLKERGRTPDGGVWGENLTARSAAPAEIEMGKKALALVPLGSSQGEQLLYARVDVVTGDDGPTLMELELVEPSLFFAQGERSAQKLAQAVMARLARDT